ncbi:MAG: peptidylprolyl isomerase [Bacteroidota bacterium]
MANTRGGGKPVIHTKKHLARLERERRQTRLILFSFIGILVVSLGLLVYGYLDLNYFQLQKPVAKVGDARITVRDFQNRVRLQRNSLLSTYQQYYQFGQMLGMDVSTQLQQIESQLNDSQALGQNVLDAMINEELIRQESAKRGITVSDQEVEAAVQAAENYYPNGSPTPTVTPTEVTLPTTSSDVLKYVTATSPATATPEVTGTAGTTGTPEGTGIPVSTGTPQGSLTPAGTLEATGTLGASPSPSPTLAPSATATATSSPTPAATETPAGTPTPEPTSTPYTLEGFQQKYADKLKGLSGFGLSEEQYRLLHKTELLRQKLYAQVTADVPHTEEQIWARHILVEDEASALAVIERLKAGEDFGDLARKLSKDTASGAKGGDLGWFGKGAMVAPFEEAAFALKVGEISKPVKSDFGYHVIQVIAREDRPLDATQYQAATDKAFQDFLDSLREPYGVETYDIWKQIVPTEPSFESMATEAAKTAQP